MLSDWDFHLGRVQEASPSRASQLSGPMPALIGYPGGAGVSVGVLERGDTVLLSASVSRSSSVCLIGFVGRPGYIMSIIPRSFRLGCSGALSGVQLTDVSLHGTVYSGTLPPLPRKPVRPADQCRSLPCQMAVGPATQKSQLGAQTLT